jgi:hypothetical protein
MDEEQTDNQDDALSKNEILAIKAKCAKILQLEPDIGRITKLCDCKTCFSRRSFRGKCVRGHAQPIESLCEDWNGWIK